jgi:hypothetical protein
MCYIATPDGRKVLAFCFPNITAALTEVGVEHAALQMTTAARIYDGLQCESIAAVMDPKRDLRACGAFACMRMKKALLSTGVADGGEKNAKGVGKQRKGAGGKL